MLVPELTRALRGDDRAADRACRVARPRTRGWTGAAGDAGPDRAERADRADAVRARRVHRSRYRGNRARADVAGARPARPCAGQGAVAGVLRARGHAHAAAGDAHGHLRSRSLSAFVLGHWFGAGGIAAGIALGAWSSALALIRRGAATFGFSIDAAARRRLPRIVAAALAMGGLLWLATRFVPALTADTHGLAQAVAPDRADCWRNGDLRPASARCSASPAGAKRLARSGKPAPPTCATRRARVAMDGAAPVGMDGATGMRGKLTMAIR